MTFGCVLVSFVAIDVADISSTRDKYFDFVFQFVSSEICLKLARKKMETVTVGLLVFRMGIILPTFQTHGITNVFIDRFADLLLLDAKSR